MAKDDLACSALMTRAGHVYIISNIGSFGEGSWMEGYFGPGQMACADLIGESLEAGRRTEM